MELYLVDQDPETVKKITRYFISFDNVKVLQGDIFEFAEGTIVIPVNGHGVANERWDDRFLSKFGVAANASIKKYWHMESSKVGNVCLFDFEHDNIAKAIAVTTSLNPGKIPPSNAFFAMTALLEISTPKLNRSSSNMPAKLYSPILGADTDQLRPEIAAKEMALAYEQWQRKQKYKS